MTTKATPETWTMEVDVERVPPDTGETWETWCRAHVFHPLTGGRRAWLGQLGTYLRDHDLLVYRHGTLIDLAHSSDNDIHA